MAEAETGKICDDVLLNLNSEIVLIISCNQDSENGGDHCLKMKGDVTCNGVMSEPSIRFKVFTGITTCAEKVCILQCASGPDKNKLIAIANNRVATRTSSLDFSQKDLKLNILKCSDVLFNYATSSSDPDSRSFRLYSDPSKVIGFDAEGLPIAADKVVVDTVESLFYVYKLD